MRRKHPRFLAYRLSPNVALNLPGFPETLLSGIDALRVEGRGTLGVEGGRLMVKQPGVPGRLVLVGREPVETVLDAAGVVPAVDVAEQRRLGLRSGAESRCGPVDQLDFDGRPQVFGQGVVERIPDAPGGRGDADGEQPLGEPQRRVLAALVREWKVSSPSRTSRQKIA